LVRAALIERRQMIASFGIPGTSAQSEGASDAGRDARSRGNFPCVAVFDEEPAR
jgi:hypothetical protein